MVRHGKQRNAICSFPKSTFGQLEGRVHHHHNKWGLLTTPRRLPTRPRKMIEDFILRCNTDPIFVGTMATLRHIEVVNLQLTDEEMEGEEVIGEELPYNIIYGRMLRDDTPKLSVVIEPKSGPNISDRLNEMLPNELIPNNCDTPESVLQGNAKAG